MSRKSLSRPSPALSNRQPHWSLPRSTFFRLPSRHEAPSCAIRLANTLAWLGFPVPFFGWNPCLTSSSGSSHQLQGAPPGVGFQGNSAQQWARAPGYRATALACWSFLGHLPGGRAEMRFCRERGEERPPEILLQASKHQRSAHCLQVSERMSSIKLFLAVRLR